MDLLQVSQISFDVDMKNCDNVWAAPLRLCPNPWVGPGTTSGEIDFVENCPVGNVATNFGGGGQHGEDQLVWGNATFLGPKHFIMTLGPYSFGHHDSGGNLATQICEVDGSNCVDGAYYNGFLSAVTATKSLTESYPYTFKSDIWNGFNGDGGWTGCGAYNNPTTTCQYAVTNIRVSTTDGSPMFSDGKCAALNAASSSTMIV